MNNKENFIAQDFLIQLEQIDYNLIEGMLSTIATLYVTKKTIDCYILHRKFKHKNINKVSLPPELKQKYSNIDIEKFTSQQFGSAIIHFAHVMIDKFSSIDLINFYNNLNELKINPTKFGLKNFILRTNIIGTYDAQKNLILVDKDNYISSIYHELFHMSSSTYKNGIIYSGFRQSSLEYDDDFGRGINEGYTELLTKRYFGDIEEVKKIYKYEVNIADKLEKIVGQEIMEGLYLNANLPGLISKLEKYAPEEEITKFIYDVDYINKNIYNKKILPLKKEVITNCLRNINEFLLRTYAKKLKNKLDNGALNLDELNKQLKAYISSLGLDIISDKHSYEFLTIEDFQEKLRTILDDSESIADVKEQDGTISKRR